MRWLRVLLLGICVVLAFLVDNIFLRVIATVHTPLVDKVVILLTIFVPPTLILVFGFFYVALRRRHILAYTISVISSVIVTIALKILVLRPRPFEVLSFPQVAHSSIYSFGWWNASFPSWHAVSFFLIVPFVDRSWRYLAFAIAILLSLLRVYTGVHYLSDVVMGAILGLGFSFVAIVVTSRKK